MEHSGFPSDETLAAFIDGRLDDVTRRRVIEHMTSCDECYSVYLAATEMQKAAGAEPPRRRILPRHFWAATLSISMAAVLTVVVFLRPHAGMDHLIVASGNLEYRTVDGRLSGFDAYRPLHDTERATPADVQKDSEKWELLDAATEVKKAAKKKPNAENLHALGVAHLLLGNWDESIDTLKESDRKRPNDAAVLNDLATAYLARATYTARPSDYVEAAEQAKRAWELKQTPEIAWTRAVAFEHLHVRTMARAAWKDYLELDDNSPWRREAETRMHDLGGPTDAQKWNKERPLFERAALNGDAAEIARIADAFPAKVAELGEEKLSHWAKDGDAASFDAGERAGAAVAARGFGYLQEACAAVRAASPAQVELTKQAMLELERGQTLFKHQQFSAAHEALASARELALRAGSPVAQHALLQLAGCMYNENDYAATTKALDALSKEVEPSAIVFRARIDWLRGLIQVESGHPDDGLRSYLSAAELVKTAGHRDWEAALNAMIGQSYQILGQPDQAWEHRLLALNLAMKAGDPSRVQYVLMESTVAAVFYERRHEIGDLLTGRLLDVSYALKKSTAIADAHIWRARYLRDSGDANALDELRSARKAAGAITDKDPRDRLMANLELAEGELLAHDEPTAAVDRLTEALRFLDRSGNHLLRAQAYSARAGAYETVRDQKSASLDREQGIAEVEAQRGRISDGELRTAFVAVARRLYTDEIDLAVTSGDYERAFDLAERSRATTAGVAPAVSLERLRQVLPVGVALIEYAALPERTVAWIVRREGVTATILPSDGKAVSAAAERLIAARTDRRSFDVAAADLYTRILAPLRPRLSSINTIVFVPEPTWTHFPFAALRDPTRKHFLFEDVDVANAPSASRLVAVIAAASRPRGPENVLVYSDPESGNAPRLAAAQREGDLVGRTFPGAAVISGNDATRENFLARARFATLIHFAGHARDDARNGDYSALVFSGDGRGDSGLLYAWEVRELDLTRTRLVVLSACGTDAISDAFLAAGAPATIATLWNIGDTHGRELMFELYGRLHDGDSPSHALRAAQLAVLHDPGSRPADWAGFELVGL